MFVYLMRRVSATQNILKVTVVTYTILEHTSVLPQPPESQDYRHELAGMMDFNKIGIKQLRKISLNLLSRKMFLKKPVLAVIEDGAQQNYCLIHKAQYFLHL